VCSPEVTGTKEVAGMQVRRSVEIAAPPERIWPFLVEPDNVLKWYPTLRTFQYEDAGQPGTGARVYAEEKASGMLMKLHFVITDWVENRTVSLHMVSGTGVKGYDQSWSVEPLPSGSRFTFEEHVELPYGPLGSLIGKVQQRSSEAHVTEMLAELKVLAEA
jgi:uncharacterized protein YndB with AHSA1/START domain